MSRVLVVMIFSWLCGLAAIAHAQPAPATAATRGSAPAIAFHYGADAPLASLRLFDIVVVDPDHGADPARHRADSQQRSELYAYVSIGEVQRSRGYFAAMPADMLRGRNAVWGSELIDQRHPQWPRLFVDLVVTPLVERGFRGVFLDNMDAYLSAAATPAEREAQQDGMVRALAALAARHPQLRLIANRGFEILPRTHRWLSGVAAESLFGRWNATARAYESVPDEDRQWLLGQFAKVAEFGLPAIAIDYTDPRDRDAMRDNARRIASLGIVPWVSDGALSMVGIGSLELMPRRVLVVHDTSFDGEAHSSPAQQSIVMPIQYLGYRVDLLDITRERLPEGVLSDRYAGVVAWLESSASGENASWTEFATRLLDQRVPLALFNTPGFSISGRLGTRMGFRGLDTRLVAPMAIAQRDPMMGFEWEPRPVRQSVLALQAPLGSRSLLRVRDARGQEIDGAAITPWGGFAFRPFTLETLGGDNFSRWVIHPIDFVRQALRLPAMPVPDPTTETGRRLLMIHIDGDGFPSRAEIPGAPFASEAMRREFIERYPVPHTVSVIEGEISEQGLFPELAPQLEAIARRIFALPHVEIASHSRSHPFRWHAITRAADAAAANPATADTVREYSLKLPGYQFNLASEITGSAAYIDRRLAPPGKKTAVFLWTGDCVPPAQALRTAWEGGLLNMNGGDTVATRRNPTLSLVAPMSIRKEGWLQIYAPNQNENVYTNLWTGPFFGFEQVIETFEITEEPLRLKPINIYYHTYAASKAASIVALRRVYDWALARPVHPVFASEYIRKVLDFEDMAIGREVAGARRWRIVGSGQLRNLRLPAGQGERIDLAASESVLGWVAGPGGDYVHLGGARAWLAVSASAQRRPAGRTEVVSANGRLDALPAQGDSLRMRFTATVAGEVVLAHDERCSVSVNSRQINGKAIDSSEIALKSRGHVVQYPIALAAARNGAVVSVRC